MRKHSGSSEFSTYTIIAILSAAISFVTMIVLTRLTSEAFFGKINKFITASNVIMSLIFLGLDSAYIRFYYEPPENSNSKQLAWKCITPAFFILAVVSIIFILFRNSSSTTLWIGGGGVLFTFAFIITVFSQFLNRFMTIYFRMNSSLLSFSIISIAFVVLTKTVFIPIYIVTPKFEDNIILSASFLTLFMISFFGINAKKMLEIPQSNSCSNYKPVYRFALLSSPVFVITYLNSYLPQIIISDNLGDSILGVYSAALLFCSAIQVLSAGFTTFWSPYMFKNYKTERYTIKRIHDVVLLGSVLTLASVLLLNDFLYLFIGEAFRRNQNILGMLLIYPIILVLVETTAYGISIEKKNEISLIIYLVSTATNVILCIFLISKFGLDGVAFASMFSAIIQMVLMTYFGQKYYCSINSIFRTLFHIFVLILSAVLFYIFYNNRIVFIAAEIAITAICLFYDKDVILWIFKILQSKRLRNNKKVN